VSPQEQWLRCVDVIGGIASGDADIVAVVVLLEQGMVLALCKCPFTCQCLLKNHAVSGVPVVTKSSSARDSTLY